ncbi:MAG: cardiolipin synthase [Phycisphaerales bacterium]
MGEWVSWTALIAFASVALHIGVVAVVAIRVLRKRKTTGVTVSWLMLVSSFPILGGIVYVLVGETWLSGRRSKRTALVAEELRLPMERMRNKFGSQTHFDHPAAEAIARLGAKGGMSPALRGNTVRVIGTTNESFDALLEDINNAKETCDLLYYIWHPAGRVNEVSEALLRAEQRGVRCRVMVDAVAGKAFLRSEEARRMRQAGIELRASLPVNLLRGSLHRVDIRNHRKLAVIDSSIGHTGSLNMADPNHFKKNEGYGEWVDLTVRVQGPAAALLDEVFEVDWAMEEGDHASSRLDADSIEREGEQVLQVVPSGPGQAQSTLFHMLNAAVHGAQERLILTTPYFVPVETFATGLAAAALRGVDTTVVVPAKVNGLIVRYASHAFYDDLLEAGVKVCLYGEGLLHAKTVTVDDAVAVIGTVNIDRRSFWLNYELSMVLHGESAVRSLVDIQSQYASKSKPLQESDWIHRGAIKRFAENAAQLFAPIL